MTTTTYPLPAAPSWATSVDVDLGVINHWGLVGEVATEQADALTVELNRPDLIEDGTVTLGQPAILLADWALDAAQARALAALLARAADVLDGASDV